ncbi:MAG: nucleotide pyrophosphohydrolase [Phycisphaerae bacterium]|nr:nucleotide pyrophosphohydrolase [Phycisphaerae bacterium]
MRPPAVKRPEDQRVTAKDDQTTVAQLKHIVAEFVSQRDWERFHDPKNLSMAIAIEAAELMEHFQWLRTDQLDSEISNDQLDEIREELADVTAFVLSLANVLKIDLSSALQRKMSKNEAKYPADEFRGRFK